MGASKNAWFHLPFKPILGLMVLLIPFSLQSKRLTDSKSQLLSLDFFDQLASGVVDTFGCLGLLRSFY